VRYCDKDDFGESEEEKALNNRWVGFNYFCPERKKDDPIYLDGQHGDKISQSLVF